MNANKYIALAFTLAISCSALLPEPPSVLNLNSCKFKETAFFRNTDSAGIEGVQLSLTEDNKKELTDCVEGRGSAIPCKASLKKFSPLLQIKVGNVGTDKFALKSITFDFSGYNVQKIVIDNPQNEGEVTEITYLIYLNSINMPLTQNKEVPIQNKLVLNPGGSCTVNLRLMLDHATQAAVDYTNFTVTKRSTLQGQLIFAADNNASIVKPVSIPKCKFAIQ